MGLLDEKAKHINDTYIGVWKLIQLLSHTNSYAEIGAYLGHINAHTGTLKLYHLNAFYQINEVYLLHGMYAVMQDIIEELIYEINDLNKDKEGILDDVKLKGEKYYWKRSDLTQFQELKDILTPTQIVEVSSIGGRSNVIDSKPTEMYLSYWNNNILPEIKRAKQISLFDLILLISNYYLKSTKIIGDFIFSYIYVKDGFLRKEQEENILRIIESLHNPMNIDKDNPSVHSILKKISVSNDFSASDYELLHITIFDTKILSDLFLSQDRDIQYFESTILFKLPNQQQDHLLKENEKLKYEIKQLQKQPNVLEKTNNKNLYVSDLLKSNNDKFCSLVYLIEDFCHTFDMLIYELSTFLLLNEFESQTIVYVNINKINCIALDAYSSTKAVHHILNILSDKKFNSTRFENGYDDDLMCELGHINIEINSLYNFKALNDLKVNICSGNKVFGSANYGDLNIKEVNDTLRNYRESQPKIFSDEWYDMHPKLKEVRDVVPQEKPSTFAEHINKHPVLQPDHPNHAPELKLAFELWEEIYVNGKYVESHSKSVEQLLSERGYEVRSVKTLDLTNLAKRIIAITNKINPKKNK